MRSRGYGSVRETELWETAVASLEAGKDAGLVVMVDAAGHGPNRPGAKMLVRAGGRRVGTVGGGTAEQTLARAAQSALGEGKAPTPRVLIMRHEPGGGPGASGMICAGTQTFVLLRLREHDLPVLRRILDALAAGRAGSLEITPEGIAFAEGVVRGRSWSGAPEGWRYREALGQRITVTLIGGGHVALALTPLLVNLGFHTVVLDDRPGLDTLEANALAHERRIVDYARIREHVPQGPDSYACIMTHGHRHDEAVLAQLTDLPLGYLGMMGSAPKVETIRSHLLDRGVPREALDAVHAPIGLPIGSNTPEEIAVSIAAEMIAIRNGVPDTTT